MTIHYPDETETQYNFEEDPVFPIPERLFDASKYPTPFVDSIEKYKKMHKESIENPAGFWGKLADDLLTFFTPWKSVYSGAFKHGEVSWFPEGQLNASFNCVDRHAENTPDKVAIIYEGDEPGSGRSVTYAELLRDVSKLANVLKNLGIKKGDTVAIYMPTIPEAVVAVLACARIGAIHSVVFAGFSADSLRERVQDCSAKIIITTDEGKRGGRTINIKRIVDEAARLCPSVTNVIVFRRTGNQVPWTAGRDLWWHEELANVSSVCPPEWMESEDPLFLLYTSGSTGKPKGVLHTTAGLLLGAAATVKYAFDCHDEDIFGCMADIGWITGHVYIIYGPLALGSTTVLFESTPTYPNPSRFWELIAKHKITQFYTAPTAIRALRRLGNSWINGIDLSSLRVIGSVGEPINPEAWVWYYERIGKGRSSVVDTYWQTETGSIIITPLPGATPMKPGSATLPFFGIEPAILEPQSGKELLGNEVTGVLAVKKPFPSIARTIYNDHSRFLDTYLNPYPGYYFTGDGATRDKDGYYWIRGRVDDVINVSGHRISTAEIESALILHHSVAEAAVIGGHDEVTGQNIHAFVTLKPGTEDSVSLERELTLQVRKIIGPFATPKRIYVVGELPKTRSGKIMRRILRKIVNNEADQLGDVSTLGDPTIIPTLIQKVKSPPLK